MRINPAAITTVVGATLMLVGVLMLTGIPFSFYYQEKDWQPLLLAGAITILVGALFYWYKRSESQRIGKRDGYLIVALCWIGMASFGTLPYLFSDTLPTFTDAFFEAISGMTTTGASVVTDIEALPKGILYWRSLSQWIGGMGIIVLTVAIFPLLGIGGVELFSAEAPGPEPGKIHPRIKSTAKILWILYVALTGVLLLILWAAGMTFYDAVNHAMTTMATGGFSTKNASMMAYDTPMIQYPIILFMIIAGINYSVIYLILTRKWKAVWKNEELKTYLSLMGILTIIISITVFSLTDLSFEKAFRDSLFQIVSLITTTGFVSADYTSYTPALTMLFLLLMFSGACTGSTSGGIKIMRHLAFFRNIHLQFKKLLHPRAVIPLKLNEQTVSPLILGNIITFLLIYLLVFVGGCLIVSVQGLDFTTAIGAVATSLGNVGPGLGKVGPVDNFAWLNWDIKWTLSFLMLLGRLELFTILILFTPYFWRAN